MNSNSIIGLTATQMVNAISCRDVSVLEVFDAHVEQIESINPDVNALVTTCFERGRREAKQMDKDLAAGKPPGPLCGLPYAVKDTINTAEVKTTFGSKLFATNVPKLDAIHVARARAAGAIVVGKTNTPEFASGGQTRNDVFGLTCNPHNYAITVTGSSGGSAAALAGYMVPIADGSDLGGSLRSPASVCGVVGFRPTAGQIPRMDNRIPFDSLHVFGPMARCVEDIALLQSVFCGFDPRCPLSAMSAILDYTETLDTDHKNCRIAWSDDPCGATADFDVVEMMRGHVRTFQAVGCKVSDECPDIADNHKAHQVFVALNAISELQVILDNDNLGNNSRLRGFLSKGEALSANTIVEARQIQANCWQILIEFFQEFDFMVWPTMLGVPYDAGLSESQIIEDWRTVELTPSLNLPAISVPAGLSSKGLPMGLQIIGPPNSDFKLLQLAFAFQQETSSR